MSRGLVLLAAAVAGCADPVIEMSLRMPDADSGAAFDTSCVTAIEVYAYGNDYPDSPNDFTRDCMDLDASAATFSEVRSEMLGNFELRIPQSGLQSIEVYGRVGACEDTWDELPPDVLFYGGAEYSGDNKITIPLQGLVSCAAQEVNVRPLNVLALAANPADCAGAALADGSAENPAFVDLGQIGMTMDGPVWFGGDTSYGELVNGFANITNARLTASKDACVGVSAYSGDLDTTSCWIQNSARLCGPEPEVGTMDWMIAESLVDPAIAANWDTAIIGSVWASTPTKAAVQGAQVTLVDPDLGEIQYVEPTGARGLTATGTSGLFVLYTDSIVDVTISGAGTSRTLRLGADPDVIAISLVILK